MLRPSSAPVRNLHYPTLSDLLCALLQRKLLWGFDALKHLDHFALVSNLVRGRIALLDEFHFGVKLIPSPKNLFMLGDLLHELRVIDGCLEGFP